MIDAPDVKCPMCKAKMALIEEIYGVQWDYECDNCGTYLEVTPGLCEWHDDQTERTL